MPGNGDGMVNLTVDRLICIVGAALSDKLTSFRGYSPRKFKVSPQSDGRALEAGFGQKFSEGIAFECYTNIIVGVCHNFHKLCFSLRTDRTDSIFYFMRLI